MRSAKGENSRKNINQYTIIQLIRDNGPMTKAEMAAKTNLTFTAINNIVEKLTNQHFIREAGYDLSSGGRKPVLLELNADALYAVGVHVSASTLKTAVINFCGVPVSAAEAKLESGTDRDTIMKQIIRAVESVIAASGVNKEQISGIGLGVPGPLDPYNGIVLTPPNIPGLASVPVQQLMRDHFGLPVMIDKDANVMALGELWFGSGRGFNNLLYLDADLGIGSGLVFNRKIHQGFPYGAGEIGHGTIDLDGPKCNCGNYGCLETVASGMAIIRRAGEEIRRGVGTALSALYESGEDALDIRHIIEAAREGDRLAVNILDESARYLGIALANAINFLAPETVIIGGLLVNGQHSYFEKVKSIAVSRSFATFHKSIVLQPSYLEGAAGITGAGALIFEERLSKE
ncbi:ROK family protein [Paenibacillus piri]|uniref:ROK family protein n=1 Tax=Paenibacillus piri TaxID=2547395 RepID=A0A4R5KSI3_9BACL|nr:ROK family protein [Paenibacillus piri]TDF98751.1 ROK family protein [Paenibacillus piri]